MHPSYVSDKPGDCPICSMKLVPIAGDAAATASSVPGRATLTLSPERRQVLGIRSEEIHHGPLTRQIRTVGRVAVDERRLHHIHVKYDGYVEHLYVDFTGQLVERGEPLLSIYSPELVASQQEYLLAYKARQRLSESGIPSVAQGSLDLLEAARQRLLLWDIRPEAIQNLEREGKVGRTLDLHSEVAGYVVQKMAFHGMRVTPADPLYDIADLRHVWVLADVYESDLPLVRIGMQGELSAGYLPGRRWRGPVSYVNPTVEEKTADRQGPDRARQRGPPAQARHVRRRRAARGPRHGALGPGERRDRQRRPQARVPRPRRGPLRAARGRARGARRRGLPGALAASPLTPSARRLASIRPAGGGPARRGGPGRPSRRAAT